MTNNYLKLMRSTRNLKQNYIAQQLGFTPGSLSHYENGIRPIGFEEFIKIANICGFDVYIQDRKSKSKYKIGDEKTPIGV